MIEKLVEKFRKKPYMMNMGAGKLSRWFDCERDDIYTAKRLVRAEQPTIKLPRILVLDIETAPTETYVFQMQFWKSFIGHHQIKSQWFILTWAAKWVGSDEIMSMKLTGEEALKEDDSRIIKGLWKVLEEADIVIAHNGDYFDIPNINTRFLQNGLGPTTHYRQIDTKKVAQKQFGFTHNSLDALASEFGLEGKKKTEFEMWVGCKKGNNDALYEMEIYNREDVILLEKVYLILRPWIKSHPNLGMYTEDLVCPHCGSVELEETEHFYYTHTGKYPLKRCKNCGAVPRGRKSVVKGKEVLISVPGR